MTQTARRTTGLRLLVTGATGNVGGEALRALEGRGHQVIAGTRDGAPPTPGIPALRVDFEATDPPDLPQFDAVFLMRPPQIADPAPFARFLDPLPRATRIVFLSVQGAGEKSYLPHARIEKTIAAMGFDHVFVRPGYFMENLLTALWPELERSRRIYLPAGKLALDWVSVRDVGAVCAHALTGAAKGPVMDVSSGTRTGFAEVCAAINRVAGTSLRYVPTSLPGYLRHARRRGDGWGYIGVMLLLHFLPRFERPRPLDASATEAALGRPAETLEAFVARNRDRFAALQ